MTDGASFRGLVGDTIVIAHTDGRPARRIPAAAGLSATSSDDRWTMAEEAGSGESQIVARTLDGSDRRVVIAGEGRFAMAAWAAGGHEFVIADSRRIRASGIGGQAKQGFWAVSYDAASRDHPFGDPRYIFSANVADFPGRNYAVATGGNRFVFKQHLDAPSPREVRIVTEWHQRLAPEARPR
jgi:hypothetical protein